MRTFAGEEKGEREKEKCGSRFVGNRGNETTKATRVGKPIARVAHRRLAYRLASSSRRCLANSVEGWGRGGELKESPPLLFMRRCVIILRLSWVLVLAVDALLIFAFKVQPRYLDWRESEREAWERKVGGWDGWRWLERGNESGKRRWALIGLKFHRRRGTETRVVHSFASTRTFRESKRGSTLDFHVGLRNNSRRGWWQLCHASNVPHRWKVVLRQVSKAEKIKRYFVEC